MAGPVAGIGRNNPTPASAYGRHFQARLGKDLGEEETLLAGHWLIDCATTMSYFDYDAAGFPIVAPDWQPCVEQCRADLLHRHPVHLPHETEPPPWTGWRQRFPGRMPATFVRDWRPETRQAVELAFEKPDWEHARAVNALRLVPFEIDPAIADLVGRFAVKIKNHGWKRTEGNGGRKYWLDQWSADFNLVNEDLAEAHFFLRRPFWLTYNTDKRGHVLSLQHLNYGREDHVRAMFRFHNGMKLGKDGLFWLAVHVANCEGSTDKLTWNERVAWVEQNYPRIERIGTAKDPGILFNEWCDADKPFAFVAACREDVAATVDPENFVAYLPVGFDHTCSGIQHLAMICRDKSAAALVNLLDTDRPQDVYRTVALKIKQVVNAAEGEFADWWKATFAELTDRDIRKLLKRPVMTFGYAAGKS